MVSIPERQSMGDWQYSFAVRAKVLPATDRRPRRLRVSVSNTPAAKVITRLDHDAPVAEQAREAASLMAAAHIQSRFLGDSNVDSICVLNHQFMPDANEWLFTVTIGVLNTEAK